MFKVKNDSVEKKLYIRKTNPVFYVKIRVKLSPYGRLTENNFIFKKGTLLFCVSNRSFYVNLSINFFSD